MNKDALAMRVKKIIKWGSGLSIFITTEAKLFGWTDKDHVLITAFEEDGKQKLLIERAPVQRANKR